MILNKPPTLFAGGWTHLHTYTHIFSWYSGISSHSFGRLYWTHSIWSSCPNCLHVITTCNPSPEPASIAASFLSHHVKFRTLLHCRHHQHSTFGGCLVMLQGREFKHTSRRLRTQVSTLWKPLLKSHCWASLPVPMPHVLLLEKCLLQPPPMDPFYLTFHSIVNNYWERIVHLFLSTHDPSQLMQFHLHFAQSAAMALDMGFAVGSSPPVCSQVGVRWWSKFLRILGLTSNIQTTNYGFVTIPLHCTIFSTIDAPFCLSSKNCHLHCHHWYWCIGLYLTTPIRFCYICN